MTYQQCLLLLTNCGPLKFKFVTKMIQYRTIIVIGNYMYLPNIEIQNQGMHDFPRRVPVTKTHIYMYFFA